MQHHRGLIKLVNLIIRKRELINKVIDERESVEGRGLNANLLQKQTLCLAYCLQTKCFHWLYSVSLRRPHLEVTDLSSCLEVGKSLLLKKRWLQCS